VLVLEPDAGEHHATLFVRPPSDPGTIDFFRDDRHGELWVGPRPSLGEVEAAAGITCRPLGELTASLDPSVATRVRRGIDAEVDALVAAADPYPDAELRALLSELRLVKDDWEVEQIQQAVDATIRGFEDVVRALPAAIAEGGERRVEGVFVQRARIDGNDAAFNPIAASGAHATTLHWTRNDGLLQPEELLLLDAGVETRTLYAADLTRTLPLGGTFTPDQRRMLELVNAAHEAALGAVRPGAPFREFRRAASTVLAEGLADWGLLPVTAAESLVDDSGLHRRYTVCAPGHMLGLDVHDCADARSDRYLDGALERGNVLTVEPGLYFQSDDLTVPERLRGVGVRIEDDVLVTESGCRVLSERLPRRPDEVESWMTGLRSE
jgi:Xaa-Pro aminopeptidase